MIEKYINAIINILSYVRFKVVSLPPVQKGKVHLLSLQQDVTIPALKVTLLVTHTAVLLCLLSRLNLPRCFTSYRSNVYFFLSRSECLPAATFSFS